MRSFHLGEVLESLVGQAKCPDMIISDYHLQDGKNGIDAISRLRLALDEPIPAFLMSGDMDAEPLRAARSEWLFPAAQAGGAHDAARDPYSGHEQAARFRSVILSVCLRGHAQLPAMIGGRHDSLGPVADV